MTTVFTIGYGNRTVNNFISLLCEYGISTLIDVRTNPFSRFNFNYNRAPLTSILKNVGIEYIYMGDVLGGKPTDHTLYLNGKISYSAIAQTEPYKAALDRIIDLAENKIICLMCCELMPENCHRKNLIGESLNKKNIQVNHINKRGLISFQSDSNSLNLF